ncbi:MAG: hypothetical protein J2P19_01290 [Pseudonocardia sp.]|nr:hypothetical protein [Pseudonocardia sp.]
MATPARGAVRLLTEALGVARAAGAGATSIVARVTDSPRWIARDTAALLEK